jgi:restriction system protein
VLAEDFEAIFSLLHDYITEKVKERSLSVVPIAADMTPIDFEHHVASELRRYGWEAEVTKASGDQGIDVIASRGRFKVGIQCKYYKGSVPNKAVQEAYTGKSHYNLHGAAVVTTGTFTKSALEVANSTGVVALNHHLLGELHLRFGLN